MIWWTHEDLSTCICHSACTVTLFRVPHAESCIIQQWGLLSFSSFIDIASSHHLQQLPCTTKTTSNHTKIWSSLFGWTFTNIIIQILYMANPTKMLYAMAMHEVHMWKSHKQDNRWRQAYGGAILTFPQLQHQHTNSFGLCQVYGGAQVYQHNMQDLKATSSPRNKLFDIKQQNLFTHTFSNSCQACGGALTESLHQQFRCIELHHMLDLFSC
jgi:hypothetical protein